ncbi:protein disulfide-isomerase A6 homolog [Dysidea avara]|uniref:protein disulfide-isomerase A6 homolog n=1 Tax=Dysidea avara TaxID=196820 RepID=UPI00331B5FAA
MFRRVMLFLALVTLQLLVSCAAFYSPGDNVVELNPTNFQHKVIQSDGIWLVEFYAPWCGHCQSLAPAWKKAAGTLKGVVNVGAVDADSHKQLAGQYGIRGFPTIKIFGANKNQPEDYQGARSADAIIGAGLNAANSLVKSRQSGGGGGSSSGGGGGSGKKTGGSSDDVVKLTDSNFEETVINSNDMWLVEFFAPWCGHCKNLAPHWASAATELKGKVKLGALDATAETVTASRFGIRGYPTIKFFPSGPKEFSSAKEYDGGRTSGDIVQWAMNHYTELLPAPEAHELTGQEVMDECTSKQLCILSFLPHILDTGAAGRNDYIALLKEMGNKYKQKSWGWVWLEGGANMELEAALGIGGFGYPAMATVNARKKQYSLLHGAFSQTGINEFLRTIVAGRGPGVTSHGLTSDALTKIPTSEPWDGQDGALPEEEDYDLSDFDMDADSDKDEL